jgi:hypothetical protein
MTRKIQRSVSLDALCDFIGGASLNEIALRYHLSPAAAEEQLRRGLYEYGFSSAPRALAQSGMRRVDILRASS